MSKVNDLLSKVNEDLAQTVNPSANFVMTKSVGQIYGIRTIVNIIEFQRFAFYANIDCDH